MYSDDDLVSDEPNILRKLGKSHPYLHFYDKEEEEDRVHYLYKIIKSENKTSTDHSLSAVDSLRHWRILGFFKSVQGFHTVCIF